MQTMLAFKQRRKDTLKGSAESHDRRRCEYGDWFMPEPGLEVLLITSTSVLVSRTSNVAGAGLPAKEVFLCGQVEKETVLTN